MKDQTLLEKKKIKERRKYSRKCEAKKLEFSQFVSLPRTKKFG